MSTVVTVSVFRDKAAARPPIAQALALQDIERQLRAAKPAHSKDQLALLKLATFGERPSASGCFRHDNNVLTVSGIEGDYDGERVPITDAAHAIENAGVEALLYTSPSHRPEAPRWRVLCPLATELTGSPDELRQARRELVGRLNAILGGVLAPESFALSQSFYIGRIAGNPDPEVIRTNGCCIDEMPNAPTPRYWNGNDASHGNGSGGMGTADDRSRDLLRHVAQDVRAGLTDDEVIARWREHPHAQDQRAPERAVRRCVEKVRADMNREQPGPANRSAKASAAHDEIHLVGLDDYTTQQAELWQYQDLFQFGDIVVVFGPPKGGKTQVVSDICMHAAHGLDYYGHKLAHPLRVAYLIGEGQKGHRRRMRGWRVAHGDAALSSDGDIKFLPRVLPLADDVEEVLRLLREYRVDLLAVDTLNAYFGGLDEDKTRDMTVFCGAIRRLRDELGCTVIVVHHSGWGDGTRERGSIVLRGTADVIVKVKAGGKGSGLIGMQVIEARDMEVWDEPLSFGLKEVETGWLGGDGRPVTTVVPVLDGRPVAVAEGRGKVTPDSPKAPRGRRQRQVWEGIVEARLLDGNGVISELELRRVARDKGIDSKHVASVVESLVAGGWLEQSNEGYRILGDK